MLWLTQIPLGLCLVLFSSFPITTGRHVNVTIDDQFGDPTNGQVIQYSPPAAWRSGQNCQQCAAKPTPATKAHNGTWMNGIFAGTGQNGTSAQIISASVPFIGTAVFVNVILTGSTSSPNGNSDFTFLVDNVGFGNFRQAPNGDSTYHFDQTIFSLTGLSNSLHTLTIESGHGGNRSLVLLDSIVYTKELNNGTSGSNSSNASSNSGGSSNVAIIVGPVIGAVAVVGAVIALFFLRRRKRPGQRVRVLIDDSAMESISPVPSAFTRGPGRVEPFVESNECLSRGKGADVRTSSSTGPSASHDVLNSESAILLERGSSPYHLETQTSRTEAVQRSTSDPTLDAIPGLSSPPAYTEVVSPAVRENKRLPCAVESSAGTREH